VKTTTTTIETDVKTMRRCINCKKQKTFPDKFRVIGYVHCVSDVCQDCQNEYSKKINVKQSLFNSFVQRMETRLEVGEIKYSDNYEQKDMFEEIEQELFDVANYAYLQFLKIEKLKLKMKAMKT
jgi:uncharacterized protein (UPF0335 family)